jgi:hypothetical protein
MDVRLLPLLLLLIWATPAAAESDGQVWYQLCAQPKVIERWSAYAELQTRYASDLTLLSALLVRPAISYNWPSGWSAWLGYLWQSSYQPAFILENRLWEQVQHDWKEGDHWWVQNRLRFEQRWTPAVSGSLRLRYQLRGLRQVTGGFFLVTSAEIFLTFADPLPGAKTGLDQARLFVGTQFKVSPEVRLEAGYMFNPVNRATGPDLNNNNLVLAVFCNPDFS